MKQFTRIDTEVQRFGRKFPDNAVIKRYRTDDGLEHEFTTVYDEGSRAVAIVALTEDNQALTVYQFRAGPECWYYDLPGGGVESGEGLEVAARRELMEETGYQPGEMEYLGAQFVDVYSNVQVHFFLATNCRRVADMMIDEKESAQGAEVKIISIKQLFTYARQGRVNDVMALFLAYETLRALQGDVS
ncbi:MAG: NUDIX hydrolase [Candidatus Saccharibacteria bacterium]|nr:NUDIX hydrolase [Candidatus Saccharibacteria bacterium]